MGMLSESSQFPETAADFLGHGRYAGSNRRELATGAAR
jgi:hypothetical protein